jgi:DNA-binding XRE family transcriptional regulator
MPQRALRHYLRTIRLSNGLSQADLGLLVGVSEDVISNCELERTNPTTAVVLGCMLLFGKTAPELFPTLCEAVQESVGAGAAALDERIRYRTDPASLKKLALLASLSARTITADL